MTTSKQLEKALADALKLIGVKLECYLSDEPINIKGDRTIFDPDFVEIGILNTTGVRYLEEIVNNQKLAAKARREATKEVLRLV